MRGRGFLALGGLAGLLCLAVATGGNAFSPDRAGANSQPQESSVVWMVADSSAMTANPHSDLIFRATGATTCMDCHRAGKDGLMLSQVQDNRLVQDLKAKAKGVHGPGRFADCLRCHAGGDKGVEKYRK
jgi:cytochrome c2